MLLYGWITSIIFIYKLFTAVFQNHRVYPVYYLNNLHLSFLLDDTPIDTSGFLFTLREVWLMSVTLLGQVDITFFISAYNYYVNTMLIKLRY